VDVSEHQEWIDWQTVADAGVDFAMVRVGYRATGSGTIVQDAYAEYNLDAVPAAGIDLGVYFYSQATTEEEAREEAEFVITLLASRELDYPIAFDFEQGNQENERVANMTYEERTLVATAFCERIEEEGLTAMVYGNLTSLSEMDVDQVASRGLWYAEYGSAPSTDLRIALWQYSETGAVPGIDGEVDLDLDLTGVWRST
jgi:GH25 family lysozyme M1 (1,4-beta-N-acetylmuramidase)